MIYNWKKGNPRNINTRYSLAQTKDDYIRKESLQRSAGNILTPESMDFPAEVTEKYVYLI